MQRILYRRCASCSRSLGNGGYDILPLMPPYPCAAPAYLTSIAVAPLLCEEHRRNDDENALTREEWLEISAAGFGCMGLGFSYSHALTNPEPFVRASVERRVTFFDTAEVVDPSPTRNS
jgi:hypothetical protein